MSALVIRLLGPPEIERDGSVVPPPRGHKTWAVLAYVLLAERPVMRTGLAELIFGDAGDPRGALRWALAQLRRALGHAGALRGDPLDHAFSLGCRIGDPCWEALAARAMGLVHEAAGERAAALAWLRDGAARVVRVADPYVWMHAYCLDALAAVAIDEAAPDARDHVTALERLAARGDMRELVVRAALHRAALGDRTGLPAARRLGEAIDNPLLHAELATAV